MKVDIEPPLSPFTLGGVAVPSHREKHPSLGCGAG